MQGRRVVITGMGTVNPLGNNFKSSWNNIIAGKSGISRVSHFPVDELPDSISKVAGQIKIEEGNPDAFDPNLYVDKKDQKKMDKFIWFSMAAAKEALEEALKEVAEEARREGATAAEENAAKAETATQTQTTEA